MRFMSDSHLRRIWCRHSLQEVSMAKKATKTKSAAKKTTAKKTTAKKSTAKKKK